VGKFYLFSAVMGQGYTTIACIEFVMSMMIFTMIITLAIGIYPTPLAQMAFAAAQSLIK
jgi:NADH-quinone oxidoreductase subunit N